MHKKNREISWNPLTSRIYRLYLIYFNIVYVWSSERFSSLGFKLAQGKPATEITLALAQAPKRGQLAAARQRGEHLKIYHESWRSKIHWSYL